MNTTAPASNALQAYQAQLQANQAALGQQLPQRQTQPSQSASVSIVAQQQLMNKTIEKQSELQLDKSRVTLLLEINAELLREVLKVQPKFSSPEEAKTDPVFRECMRRLQQNLAYLAAIADRSHKPASLIPACPGVLLPPPDMPVLDTLYRKLHDLYPGINPANPPQPPQQHQGTQLAPPRTIQNVSPKPSGPQQNAPVLQSMPPPHHGSPQLSSPSHMPSHHSPPGVHGMQMQPQQPPQTPQHHPQPDQHQQMLYQTPHAHSQSPPLQDPRMQQQQHYAQLQQQQRQAMMRQQQQQQHLQQQQQQGHMAGQMGIPTSMGMSASGPGMNGMSTSMASQPQVNPNMIGGMAMGGAAMGGVSPYVGMGNMSSPTAMGGMGAMTAPMNTMPPNMQQMGQMGQMAMSNMAMAMGGMPSNMTQPGFDMSQAGMWNGGYMQGGP